MITQNTELEDSLESHLRPSVLIDYYLRRLGESEREAVQSHLVACHSCIGAFREVRDFFQPYREGEQTIDERQIEHERKRFWTLLNYNATPVAAIAPPKEARFSLLPGLMFACAALLIAALTLAIIYAMKFQRENEQLIRQMDTLAQQGREEQQRLLDQNKLLEEENLRLQTQAPAPVPGPDSQRGKVDQPILNAQIYDIFSRASLQRSGTTDNVNVIASSRAAKSIVLILHTRGQAEYPTYSIEITNSTGQLLWKGKAARQEGQESLAVAIERSRLARGRYQLRLYGPDGRASQAIAEYIIQVE